ncbi:hypothetical protein EV421DRAFT_513746 [Armillaria borealis]|uniref:Uncharacterized protein n=1 Tax=Armillaria borealis TaxID=47425 RepID=A0AA39JKD5_9AGAR|nr:hypothetical protein EV421DRAFT_513746 [Armillaria borealis]
MFYQPGVYSHRLPWIPNISAIVRAYADEKVQRDPSPIIYGQTESDALLKGYGAKEAAGNIMVEIKLPACHNASLSKGSIAAVSFAVYCLEKVVISLFLVSPLGLEAVRV